MANSVLIQEELEIPFVFSLADFRAWAAAEGFPERGRIDYIAGRIEVDMSPEDLYCHGQPKTQIVLALGNLVYPLGLGELFIDRTRVSSVEADLSTEPDIVFISEASLETGRVRPVPKATGEADRFVEFEGAPDLVVEIVSDGSVAKDTRRLPAAYWKAGVREFWLADLCGDEVVFRIHHDTEDGYVPAPVDADGFQHSEVFNRRFRLIRRRNSRGRWTYELEST